MQQSGVHFNLNLGLLLEADTEAPIFRRHEGNERVLSITLLVGLKSMRVWSAHCLQEGLQNQVDLGRKSNLHH